MDGTIWKGGGMNDGVMYGKTSQVFLEFFSFSHGSHCGNYSQL